MYTQERANELLNECLGYLVELWDRYSTEEWNDSWQNIIGLTEEEMREEGLIREE